MCRLSFRLRGNWNIVDVFGDLFYRLSGFDSGLSSVECCLSFKLGCLQSISCATQLVNLFLIGIHNAHGEAQLESLTDFAWMVRRRPWASNVVAVGDWNVDQM